MVNIVGAKTRKIDDAFSRGRGLPLEGLDEVYFESSARVSGSISCKSACTSGPLGKSTPQVCLVRIRRGFDPHNVLVIVRIPRKPHTHIDFPLWMFRCPTGTHNQSSMNSTHLSVSTSAVVYRFTSTSNPVRAPNPTRTLPSRKRDKLLMHSLTSCALVSSSRKTPRVLRVGRPVSSSLKTPRVVHQRVQVPSSSLSFVRSSVP